MPMTSTTPTSPAPFAVGTRLFHPAHGALTVTEITRDVPESLYEPSTGPVRVAFTGKDHKVVSADPPAGEVKVVPAKLRHADEDFYVLERPPSTTQIVLRVSDARAWGARAAPSSRDVDAAFEALKRDAAVDPKAPWSERFPVYSARRNELMGSIETVRELCRIKGDRELTFGEKRMLDDVSKLVADELSLAPGRDRKEIEAELTRVCGEQERMGKQKGG